MGRNGISVAFRGDVSGEPANPYARAAEALSVLVDDVVAAEFTVGLAMARRAKAIERARVFSELTAAGPGSTQVSRDLAHRSFAAEIGAALRVPDGTAEHLIETSRVLVNELPSTLQALGEGRLSYRHGQVLVNGIRGLEPAAARELETLMLPVAERNTPSRLERSVRRTRERLNPESMPERHVLAVEERATEFTPEQDGMARVGGYVSAVLGVAIDARLTEIAKSLQGAGETRTLAQLKADVFCDILLDVEGQAGTTVGAGDGPIHRYRSIRPRVLVTVPAMTLLGRSTEPGVLEGYGPIDARTAREIASFSKTMQRLLTDPVTGIVLAMDRTRYRIPKDLRIWLRVRDGSCRFPGCNRSAGKCDIDHTQDWALDGLSNHDNLAHLCPGHHMLKGATDWTVKQTGGGTLTWASPAGVTHITEPELTMEPAPTPSRPPRAASGTTS